MCKKFCISVFASICLVSFSNASELKTDVQKESYSIGASTGGYIYSQLVEQSQLGAQYDVDAVIKGLVDALNNSVELSDNEIITHLNDRADKLNAAREAAIVKALADNKAAGKKYMAENAKRKGVKTTKSGVQYEVLTKGKGEMPKKESVIQLHYKAYLVDGAVFDTTYEENIPANLTVFNLIDGLNETILLMNEGSKVKIVIPSDLAYGDEAAGSIPGGSTVIFETELVKVYKPGELTKEAQELLKNDEIMKMHSGMGIGAGQ